jgi:hypothetical protein
MHDPPHPPHLNGNSAPAPPNTAISPTAGPAPNGVQTPSIIQKLNTANEQTWLLIGEFLFSLFSFSLFLIGVPPTGRVAEQMGDLEHALSAYENALRHNPMSLSGLTQVAGIARIKENYPKVCNRVSPAESSRVDPEFGFIDSLLPF